MNDDIKQLHKIINKEYYNIRKRFNIDNKNKIKNNSKDIEDILHDCLLKVLEKALLDNFNYINDEKTINYINKTMFISNKHLKEMKEKKEVEDQEDNNVLIEYININYTNNIIENSIFNKLLNK